MKSATQKFASIVVIIAGLVPAFYTISQITNGLV